MRGRECSRVGSNAARRVRSVSRLLAAALLLGSLQAPLAPSFAKDSAAEAQAKALEAMRKQQEAAIKAAQKAQQEAQRAAQRAQQEAQRAAQRAAQEAARRAAQEAAAQRAAQAAAQKAAQDAARKAAQEAASQAAAQKAAQAAAQRAAQEAAKRAAQEAAAQAAAQKAAQAAAQKAAQQASPQPRPVTSTPSAPATPAPIPTPVVSQPPAVATPSSPVSADVQGSSSTSSAAGFSAPVPRQGNGSDNLPNDVNHRDGVMQFAPGEFQKVRRETDGPAKPDWAPDPSILTAPRSSSSIKHAEPEEELAKDLKLRFTGADVAAPPAPSSSTTETPPKAETGQAAPQVQPVAGAQGSKPAPQPRAPVPTSKQPGEEVLATGLSEKQVKVLGGLGVQTETVTMPATGTAVQRIRVPTGMTADQLKAVLTKQMPLTPFVPNHRFIIFGGAAGEAPKEDGPAEASCAGDACFGPGLVHWTRSLNECTRDVKVGIIDTSFDTAHPAFRDLKASHGQFLNGEKPSPLDWHGTAVLSELGGHPDSGTPGLIPHAHFFLAAAFRTDESGNASTDTVRLLSALEWMEALGVQYINMSFTGPRDDLIEAAIRRMRKKGVVFIAAAGNQGPNAPPSYPAAYADVIAVTAINRKGESYRSANRGSYIDVSAPGVDIPAALPNGKQGLRTGTSFAAPFVTAILAARMPRWQAAVDKGDMLTGVQIADLGPPGRDPIYGAGLALAPQQCGGEPGGGVASTPPAEPDDQAAVPLDRPALGAFAPASGLGFRSE